MVLANDEYELMPFHWRQATAEYREWFANYVSERVVVSRPHIDKEAFAKFVLDGLHALIGDSPADATDEINCSTLMQIVVALGVDFQMKRLGHQPGTYGNDLTDPLWEKGQ